MTKDVPFSVKSPVEVLLLLKVSVPFILNELLPEKVPSLFSSKSVPVEVRFQSEIEPWLLRTGRLALSAN